MPSRELPVTVYDEVWQRARDMGYPNVGMALDALAKLKEGARPAEGGGQ